MSLARGLTTTLSIAFLLKDSSSLTTDSAVRQRIPEDGYCGMMMPDVSGTTLAFFLLLPHDAMYPKSTVIVVDYSARSPP